MSEISGSATSTLLALVRYQCFWLTNEIANQYRFFASLEKAFPLDTESFRNFKPKFRLNGKPPSILFLTGISEYHCTICVITLVCETMVLFRLAENSHQFFHANGKISYVSIPFLHQWIPGILVEGKALVMTPFQDDYELQPISLWCADPAFRTWLSGYNLLTFRKFAH